MIPRLGSRIGVAVLLVVGVMTAALSNHALYLRDTGVYFLPHRLSMARALRALTLPEWNPFEYGGMPLLVDPNYSVFHPLTWLHALWPTSEGYSLLVILSLLLGALGMARLAARCGIGSSGRWVAAACFVGSGTVVSLSQSGQFVVVCTLPWVCLAARRTSRGDPARNIAGIAVASALLLLAGTPEVGACGFLLAAVMASSGPAPQRALTLLGLGIGLSLLLAAAQLLPTGAFLLDSSRSSAWSLAQATDYSLHPLRLLDLFLPFSTSAPDASALAPSWLDAPELSRTWIIQWSFGTLPGVLACVGWRGAHRAVRRALVVALLLLLLAFGAHTTFSTLLWEHLPLLRTVRFPEKFAIPLVLPLALLAGRGWNVIRRHGGPSRPSALISVGLLWVASWALPEMMEEALVTSIGPTRVETLRVTFVGSLRRGFLLVFLALALLEVHARGLVSRTSLRALLGALLALEITSTAVRLVDVIPSTMVDGASPLLEVLRRDANGTLDASRIDVDYRLSREDIARATRPGEPPERAVQRLQHEALYGAAPILHGVHLVRGYSGFTMGSMKRLFQSGRAREALRLLGVRYAVQLGTVEAPYERLGFQRLLQSEDGFITVWKNPDAGPRAFLTTRVISQPGDGAIPPCDATWLSSDDVTQLPPTMPVASECTALVAEVAGATIRDGSANGDLVEIHVETPQPALLVLSEAWAEGWTASVDGMSVPLLRANGALRALVVPQGAHTVRMRYQTPGLLAGMALSALAWSMLGLTLVLRRQRHDRRPRRPA